MVATGDIEVLHKSTVRLPSQIIRCVLGFIRGGENGFDSAFGVVFKGVKLGLDVWRSVVPQRIRDQIGGGDRGSLKLAGAEVKAVDFFITETV